VNAEHTASRTPPAAVPAGTTDAPAVLFTAFEPSGDDHASAVIAELRKRHPDLAIHAWGGPKMRAAGAEVIQLTGADAVVGLPGMQKILEHRQINRDIAAWLAEHPQVKLHIPVDSPAANFPICKIAKHAGLTVIHLVAPQLWAWGPWRVNKLRKRTDLVLCFLPFEEPFFRQRGVPARFIGHPLFDEPLDTNALIAEAHTMPQGEPSLAVLPGSRPAEIRRNFPVMLAAFRELRKRHPALRGLVAATTEEVRESLYDRASMHGGWPEGLDVVVGKTDLAIAWCDIAAAVSGTVTLQIARQHKPMVVMYKTNELTYKALGRFLITTDHFTLPNLIAGREIVPELVPYFTGHERLTNAVADLIKNHDAQRTQRKELADITAKFDNHTAASDAANAIEQSLNLAPRESPSPPTDAAADTTAAHAD
jgi:lipid-A-disaccharide synthase